MAPPRIAPDDARRAPSARLVRLRDGRRLSVRLWRGRGTPIVLLHGLLDSASGWDRLASSVPNPCIALNLPGFGGSDLPANPRLTAYAGDVIDALDRIGIEDFALVGHSLGGGVAAAVSEQAGARVSTLLMLAPAGFGRIALAEAVSAPALRGAVARSLPLALANPLVVTTAYMTMVARHRLPDRELLNRIVRGAFESVPGAREATRAVVAAGFAADRYADAPHPFRGPVHAVWGSHDRLVPPAHAATLRLALPHARLDVWRGMGHHPQGERPEQLARLVVRVAATPAAASAPAAGPPAADMGYRAA